MIEADRTDAMLTGDSLRRSASVRRRRPLLERLARRSTVIGGLVAAAEFVRLCIGLGYVVVVYFGGARSPRPELLRAARLAAAIRGGGLVLAGTSGRRTAGALVAGGSATSATLGIAAARRTPSAIVMP
jgi:hypothetical protein